ncbi:insig domain-containing [Pyrenophora seminiperda CCB06]|uniref:Insig domain-containing n=1 Tax=Pyrenophora seminiperda CCB06 TaxID=1302712 RepID=A0A3M7ME92_9PLEO|nr:insig domain-containing [Pyrenophora seminiperda CCB06]
MAEDAPSNANAAQAPLHIHRPIPRRHFDASNDAAHSPTHDFSQSTPPSANETRRSADFLAQLNARLLRTCNSRNDESEESERQRALPPRNKSLLNMSSTLSGIYDETGESTFGDYSMAETPWGTGAESPAHMAMGFHAYEEPGMGSPDGGLSLKNQARGVSSTSKVERRVQEHAGKQPRRGIWKYAVIVGKLAALYAFGVIYGIIVSHLHETRQLAAVHVDGVGRESQTYLASWGLFGVALGSLLPYVDLVWAVQKRTKPTAEKEAETHESPISEQVNDVVRSVAAFLGIAFAIVCPTLSASSSLSFLMKHALIRLLQRRLPWQSTLQLTLTLALVNPALWYILDRSKPGLSVSLTVTSILTSFIFLSNPNVLPSPSLPPATNATHLPSMSDDTRLQGRPSAVVPVRQEFFAGMISYESLAVVTWVGSVLFCSCVCFGSIGRRLAILEQSGWKRE